MFVPSKILQNLNVFLSLLGITVASSREVENNAYAKFRTEGAVGAGSGGKQGALWEMCK